MKSLWLGSDMPHSKNEWGMNRGIFPHQSRVLTAFKEARGERWRVDGASHLRSEPGPGSCGLRVHAVPEVIRTSIILKHMEACRHFYALLRQK